MPDILYNVLRPVAAFAAFLLEVIKVKFVITIPDKALAIESIAQSC